MKPFFQSRKKKCQRIILGCLIFSTLWGYTSCATVEDPPQTVSTEGAVTTVPEEAKRTPEQIENFGKITYSAGEGLQYNGIELPAQWPPRTVDFSSGEVQTPPYLIAQNEGGYRPEVLDITVGRQLFVDNYLIENTDLKTVFHSAVKSEGNPVLKPGTVDELTGSWGCGTSAGGIWYDMQDCKYKMWYDVGFNPKLGYAESDDGIHWTRINNESGTNVVMGADRKNGTCSVIIDYDCDPSEKYKMLVQSLDNCEENGALSYTPDHIEDGLDHHHYVHTLYTSADGIHWTQLGETSLGSSGDMTTAFYNAFTGKWIVSLREYAQFDYQGKTYTGRVRYYYECDRFADLLTWKREDAVKWLSTNDNDPATGYNGNSAAPQCYNFTAVAYESIMLGSYQIWMGPENDVIEGTGNPKITEIMAAYSRDGFYYERPDSTPLISASRIDGAWDKGYLFCTVGGIVVHDDTIDIYYSGFSGWKGNSKGAHYNQSIGVATIRRDGFASMEGSGELLTRKLTVNGEKKYLFVNVDCPAESFKAEVLGTDGKVIDGFSMEDCIAVGGDDTCLQITWKDGKDLSFLNGTEFQIRFSMEKSGKFYSFWLSDSLRGESDGAIGAGYVQ